MVIALPEGSMVFEKDSLIEPPNLWLQGLRGTLKSLTGIDAATLAEIEWPEVIRFKFSGAGADTGMGPNLASPATCRWRKSSDRVGRSRRAASHIGR